MSYFIRPDYNHREHAFQSDVEIHIQDECQDEVYDTARKVFDKYDYDSVLDIGCGGAFKLIKYFGDLDYNKVLGVDTKPTIQHLFKKYPNRYWSWTPLNNRSVWDEYVEHSDLVICSDVIEHLYDPDVLLDFIQHIKPKRFVISTPDRNKLQEMFWSGPPKNTTHYREWNYKEFGDYIESRFVVEEHMDFGPENSTQLIIGRLR
jgi:2-polyprenyl-3-methyl-5-hydroxy-6-metoxy-1,4-benzoquinol methylase